MAQGNIVVRGGLLFGLCAWMHLHTSFHYPLSPHLRLVHAMHAHMHGCEYSLHARILAWQSEGALSDVFDLYENELTALQHELERRRAECVLMYDELYYQIRCNLALYGSSIYIPMT